VVVGGQTESILQGRMNLFTTQGEIRAEQESLECAGDSMISTGTGTGTSEREFWWIEDVDKSPSCHVVFLSRFSHALLFDKNLAFWLAIACQLNKFHGIIYSIVVSA
jgi:hypothetical protein